MNRRFITATHIWPMGGTLPEDPVLVFEGSRIIDIIDVEKVDVSQLEHYDGTLIPGLVNAHCHLELSYMEGKIDSGTGLTTFLTEVVTQDPVPEEIVKEAIIRADKEMQEAGIVAVGDISNRAITASVKASSPINYYTFVEMFDFLNPDRANGFYNQYELVYEAFEHAACGPVVRVPHSPYTVSNQLMSRLAQTIQPGMTGSIHMLENEQEGYLLSGAESDYPGFFELLGFGMDHYQAPHCTSMEQFMESGYQPDHMLFVHNTVADRADLGAMRRYNERKNAYLVTCPNANLYIESRLPKYDLWLESKLPICIGTDSYASNGQLSIWHEICTIQNKHPELSWKQLVEWGTVNGAIALGMQRELGSLESGKSPGLVLLEHTPDELINESILPRKII
ncbi:amidohydrolase family protein [Membranicola marinus]|uniref:Amidohydrolase family protein n=1 Tax=Membranihabitans marinus TaxID=1227546 RepID=A0A953L722_9BACT|nr:amidohydrolase family protein [Membranihabitans marinus]MBY5958272.1 amidohydrolase family protein [Membranihabitans marinus]